MTEPNKSALLAQAAEEAKAAAERAVEAEQVNFLDAVKHIKELNIGTDFQNRQLRSRYISLFGLERFTKLVTNSR